MRAALSQQGRSLPAGKYSNPDRMVLASNAVENPVSLFIRSQLQDFIFGISFATFSEEVLLETSTKENRFRWIETLIFFLNV